MLAFERRLDELESGAQPSGADPTGQQPEHAPPPSGVGAAAGASGTDNNQPLRHGVAGQTPNREMRAR